MASMNAAHLFGSVLFGAIGVAAFIYGKKQAAAKPMIVGILLIAFPYFITNSILLYVIGTLLTAALFIFP